jgi:hypothetical protein
MGFMRGLAVVAMATAVVGTVRSAAADEAKRTDAQGSGKQCECAPCAGGTAVQQINKPVDTTADKANRAVVGDQVQNENNWSAAHPREAERREKAVEGRTSMQPEGRTNLQPEGRTSMQPGEVTPPAPAEPGGFGGIVRDVTRSVDRPGKYNPFSIGLNPLGLFVGGRLSFEAEWAPTVHHAIVVSPHFVHTTADVATGGNTTMSQAFTGIGGEIGYRYYTGHRGMNGIFVGPSLIAGVYNAGLPTGNQAFSNVGLAADVGLQDVLWNHVIVGGGVGLEYLLVSHDFGDLPAGPSTVAASGLKPRMLFTLGYGF